MTTVIARTIRERTHGEPPDRACLPGSDEKWDGYLLGVEEASGVADELLRGAVSALEKMVAVGDLEATGDDTLSATWVAAEARKALARLGGQ